MNRIISLGFPTLGYSLIKTEEMEQFPQLSIDIVKIILSNLKLSEISNLTLSCKQWSKYTGPYLKLLKNEAIRLSNNLDNGTYI
jgi:F-box domain